MIAIEIKPLYRQSFTHKLADNTEFSIELYYSEFMHYWYMNISYLDKNWKGLRLVINKNILSQFSNVIPFGIAIAGKFPPLFVDDFENGNNEFLILNQEEISNG